MNQDAGHTHDHDHDHDPHDLIVLDGSFEPVRRAEIASVVVDGETVAYDTESGEVHVLNPTATLVWECLQVPGPLSELIDDLVAELGAEPATVQADVLDAVQEMVRAGLVTDAAVDDAARPGREPVAGGAPVFLPESPTTCMNTVDALGWVGTHNVRVGNLVLGVRANSEPVLAFLGEALRDHLVAGDPAPQNYSVQLGPESGSVSKRDLHVLYRSCELTTRSRVPSRVVGGLLAQLSAQLESQEGGPARLATLTLVGNGRVVLANRRFRAIIEKLEPRLNAMGIAVCDAPAVELHDDAVVIPEPRFMLPAGAGATLAEWDAGFVRGREPEAVAPGRYELAGFIYEVPPDVATEPATPRALVLELLARVTNLGHLDGQAALDLLTRAQARVPSRSAAWNQPRGIAETAAELVGRG